MKLSRGVTDALEDSWTVARKELKELLAIRSGQRRSPACGAALLLLVSGMLAAWLGQSWLSSPAALLFWIWMPAVLAMTVVTDSFAGERERHTLEALLSTRLPEKAILFGKVAAIVSYSWSLAVLCLAASVLIANFVEPAGAGPGWSLTARAEALSLGALTALLVAGVGALISLRTSTVRQARGVLILVVLAVCLGIGYTVQMAARFLPQIGNSPLPGDVTRADVAQQLMIAGVLLLALDLLLLAVAAARFRRHRLTWT